MVQVRWDHLNRDASLLTKSQAIFLDGHFVIEHTARNRSGRFMHFNGTAGVWRRTTIDDGGGWQHDTLTEDLDLSLPLPDQGLAVRLPPAVLRPGRASAGDDRLQAAGPPLDQGLMQTAHQAAAAHPALASTCRCAIKIEAFFHLTNTLVYPLMVLLTLLMYPTFFQYFAPFKAVRRGPVASSASACSSSRPARPARSSCSARRNCSASRPAGRSLLYLPFLMGLGVGVGLNNAKAVFEAIWSAIRGQAPANSSARPSTAHRPRQRNDVPRRTASSRSSASHCRSSRSPWAATWPPASGSASGTASADWTHPVPAIFAGGYFYVGFSSLYALWRYNRKPTRAARTRASSSCGP